MDSATAAFLNHYRSLGLDGVPCSPSEVQGLERRFGVTLPAAYRAYLLIAGRRPPSAWVGTDCTIGWLYELREGAEDLLREQGQPPLPAEAFVFLMHQGYQFMYFLADGSSDDPPVYYSLEGEPRVVRKFERVSDLVACATGE
jgi:SMI1 / KNR4 family (SUKH-1)